MGTWLSAALMIQVSYLVTAFLFVMGLKRMSSPVTARSGILWAGAGMLVATLATFFYPGMSNYPLILIAVAIGATIAWISGRRVAMTNMPQMIALYNGMGGGAAAAIAAIELYRGGTIELAATALAVIGGIIGAVSFSGSLIAFGKLQGLIRRSLRFRGQQMLNLLVLAAAIVLGALIARAKGWRPTGPFTLGTRGWLVNGVALAYGVSAIVNILWPRSPNDPWYVNYAMLVTTIGVLVLGGLYMVVAKPYEHGHAPAGDAHRLGSGKSLPAAEVIG